MLKYIWTTCTYTYKYLSTFKIRYLYLYLKYFLNYCTYTYS